MSKKPDTVAWIECAPTDEEVAREAAERYRGLDSLARMRAFADLLHSMDILLKGRRPVRTPDDEAFWRHWKDPALGRPE